MSHYELLGVKSDASLEEIKKAFFDKSKKVTCSLLIRCNKMFGHTRAAFHISVYFETFPGFHAVAPSVNKDEHDVYLACCFGIIGIDTVHHVE